MKQGMNFKNILFHFILRTMLQGGLEEDVVIPIWQMSKARQREVKYLPEVIQGAD